MNGTLDSRADTNITSASSYVTCRTDKTLQPEDFITASDGEGEPSPLSADDNVVGADGEQQATVVKPVDYDIPPNFESSNSTLK